jgi:hypothetical protein
MRNEKWLLFGATGSNNTERCGITQVRDVPARFGNRCGRDRRLIVNLLVCFELQH